MPFATNNYDCFFIKHYIKSFLLHKTFDWKNCQNIIIKTFAISDRNQIHLYIMNISSSPEFILQYKIKQISHLQHNI